MGFSEHVSTIVLFVSSQKQLQLPLVLDTSAIRSSWHLHEKRAFWKTTQVLFQGGVKKIQRAAHTDVVAQVLRSYWLLSTHVQPGGTTFDPADWWCWQLAEGWPRSDASADLRAVVHWSPKTCCPGRLHTCVRRYPHIQTSLKCTHKCLYTCTHVYAQLHIHT